MSVRLYEINTVCGVGSTGRIAAGIAKQVMNSGGECRIAYGVDQASEALRAISLKLGSRWERKLHGALIRLLDMDGYGSPLATRKLIRDMERFKPNIVHLHNLHGGYLNLGMLFRYLKKANIPVVWTLHDCWAFTGHCAYFDYATCEKWMTGCCACPQKKAYPNCYGLSGARRNYRLKKRLFLSLPKLTLTPCTDWLRGLAQKSFLQRVPMRTIHNGIDLKRFQPLGSDIRERNSVHQKYIVLSVASDWDQRKGIDALIALSKRLGAEYRVVAVGLTKQQIAALPENMLGVEKTSSIDELASWYSAADVFADTTLEDNMPTVLLEALSCGTPVVSFDTGGCGECFDESCGVLVAKGDVSAMSDAIRTIAPQKLQLTDACLRYARRFDEKTAFAPYLSLYEEIIK